MATARYVKRVHIKYLLRWGPKGVLGTRIALRALCMLGDWPQSLEPGHLKVAVSHSFLLVVWFLVILYSFFPFYVVRLLNLVSFTASILWRKTNIRNLDVKNLFYRKPSSLHDFLKTSHTETRLTRTQCKNGFTIYCQHRMQYVRDKMTV
mmetsp:Transcript_11465/g.24852  ORF Transcript_11465/g.24852 Transcript_11465/m.24852 type:complete len:150 (+) Transcript_11465:2178-2627(+)